MGCDIHLIGQRHNGTEWETVETAAFGYRSYALFGFLADVRNYSAVKPISEERGRPEDFSDDDDALGDHSFSWLSVSELLAFNYDAMTEDRRCQRQIGPNAWTGAATCESGEGKAMTYREFLGEKFFNDLSSLVADGIERIVFGFDS